MSPIWLVPASAPTVQGDFAGALQSYQAGMGVAQKLAISDLSSTQSQRDIWGSLWRLVGFSECEVFWADVPKALETMMVRVVLLPTDERYLVESRRRAIGVK